MIPYGCHSIDEQDIAAVARAMKSSHITQGPEIDAFEREIADYVGAKYAVAVSSGTSALHLAYLAAGLDNRSSLLTSPITFVATANSALFCGSRVFFADINGESFNIDPTEIERVVRKEQSIKVICPVHFAGMPCDMEAIFKISLDYNLTIVEDAAHALGGVYPNGRRIGSCEHSLMTVFSLHPVKSIAVGEGGLITTNDLEVYKKLLRLRSHGINKNDDVFINKLQSHTNNKVNPWYYEMQELGFNFRFNDILAALGRSQLQKINYFMKKRTSLANRYDLAFREFSHIIRPQKSDRLLSGNHLYTVCFEHADPNINRFFIMEELQRKGIGSQVHYLPIPMHPFYQQQGLNMTDLPKSYEYYNKCLSLPLFPHLTESQQDYIIEVIFDMCKVNEF